MKSQGLIALFAAISLLSQAADNTAPRSSVEPSHAQLETFPLPPLVIEGQSIRAHTQGLEAVDGYFYVTARQDQPSPKRALLLRTRLGAGHWDSWDITSATPDRSSGALDHPGGLQSDGQRLWVPVSESVPRGKTRVRAYALKNLAPARPAVTEFEFPVDDHVGAVAVDARRRLLLGASWDTATVYVWDFDGRVQRALNAPELAARQLGLRPGGELTNALAVQDWKMIGDQLFASGLRRDQPRSQLIVFKEFLQPGFRRQPIPLPAPNDVLLAREGMTVSAGWIYFLPGDLAASNRLFRIRLPDIVFR